MKAAPGALLKLACRDPIVIGMVNKYEAENNKYASPVKRVEIVSATKAKYYSNCGCVAIMEERTDFEGRPRLKIYTTESFNYEIGTAYLTTVYPWTITYYYRASEEGERTLSKSEIDQIFPGSDQPGRDEIDKEDPPPKKDPPPGGGGGVTTPSGCASLLIGGLIVLLLSSLGSALVDPLTNAYSYSFQVLDVVKFITIRIPWLIVLVACLLYVRLPGDLGFGVMVYYVFLLLFTSAAMVFVGIAINDLMNNFQHMRRPLYELAFNLTYAVPLLVYGLVLKFICWLARKSRRHDSLIQMTRRAVGVMCIFAIIYIMIARIAAAYVWLFDMSQTGTVLIILRLIWYFALTGICASIPGAIVGA